MADFDKLAQDVAALVLERLEPEFKKALMQKIIDVAADRWRFYWQNESEITDLIDRAVQRAIDEDYKDVLEYIAKEKAKKKILKRATQNGLAEQKILDLFEKIDTEETNV
jgi:hypothetical protein